EDQREVLAEDGAERGLARVGPYQPYVGRGPAPVHVRQISEDLLEGEQVLLVIINKEDADGLGRVISAVHHVSSWPVRILRSSPPRWQSTLSSSALFEIHISLLNDTERTSHSSVRPPLVHA